MRVESATAARGLLCGDLAGSDSNAAPNMKLPPLLVVDDEKNMRQQYVMVPSAAMALHVLIITYC